MLTAPRTDDIAAALLCAAGTSRPPRGERLARLREKLRAGQAFTATLAGARIEADAERVTICRDAGEIARGGLAPIELQPGTPAVWDGRYELTADEPVTVRALKGLAAKLPAAERARLRAVPAAARPALPVTISRTGAVSCPLLVDDPPARARPLILARLEAATGGVEHEEAV